MQIDSVTTIVDNKFGEGFSVLGTFMQASIVVQAVMVLLVVMSVWSWAVMIDKSLTLGKLRKKASKFEDIFWSGKPLDELFAKMKDRADHPMAKVFAAAMGEWDRAKSVTRGDALMISAKDRIDKVMNVTVSRELERAEKGMSTLAIVASSAVFIGLFGTVWGIMNAFEAIGKEGNTSLVTVAPALSEALFLQPWAITSFQPGSIPMRCVCKGSPMNFLRSCPVKWMRGQNNGRPFRR